MRNFILYNPEETNQLTARDAAEKVWSHTYHDARRIGKTYSYASGLALASFIAIGFAGAASGDAQSFISTGLTTANLILCGVMGLAYEETQKKLGWMRETFERAANGFSERDSKLTANFRDALNKPRARLHEYMYNFKKFPIQAFIAVAAVAAGFLSRQPSIMAMGATVFMFTVLAEEEGETKEISKQAHKAKDMIELCNKLGLN